MILWLNLKNNLKHSVLISVKWFNIENMFLWFNFKVWHLKHFRNFFCMCFTLINPAFCVFAVVSPDYNHFSASRSCHRTNQKCDLDSLIECQAKAVLLFFGTKFQRDSGIQFRGLLDLHFFERGDYCRKSSFSHMCRCEKTRSGFVPASLRECMSYIKNKSCQWKWW